MKYSSFVVLIIFVIVIIFLLSSTSFAQNETEMVNDTNINQTNITCGNMICEFNEILFCPEDCNNCSSDLECDDGNQCTIDICEGVPKNCINMPVNCDDNNPATVDECIEGKCKHIETTECKGGDNFCPPGCNSDIDSDCAKENLCESIRDCDDNNPCTTDLCEGVPKSCIHTKENGCISENFCISYGTRDKINGVSSYCSTDNKWQNQKPENSLCDEDYECVTNKCSQGKCMKPAREPTLLEKIIEWIVQFFSFFK